MLYVQDSNRPYSIEFVDKFVSNMAGIKTDNDEEKYNLLSVLNDDTTYNIKRSARVAYNGFCIDRLLLILQIEKIMNIKPNYKLSSDIYNTLESSTNRGMILKYINPWSNLNQNPTLNSFIFYVKSILLKYKNSGIIDSSYSKILDFVGSQVSGREDIKTILKNKCEQYGLKYQNIELRYGKNDGKWISPSTQREESVENCVLEHYIKKGWKGLRLTISILKKLLTDDDYCQRNNFSTSIFRQQLLNIFSESLESYKKGLPDLILWNDDKIAFCEVKSPTDNLNKSQISLAYKIAINNKTLYHLVHVVGLFE